MDYLPIMNAKRSKGPRRVVSSRHANAWTPLRVPMRSARVALVSSGAIRTADQRPFEPSGDASYRVAPFDADPAELRIDHRSSVGTDARKDLEVVLPRKALAELARNGTVGSVAPSFFSFVGGIELHQQVEEELAPEMARELRDLGVDLAVLVPY